jgi:glycosyltransferase involved in cell wall biosynthesis
MDSPGLKLVVLIPALNEEKTIASVIGAIPTALPGVSQSEIVVVDDGSTDATAAIARGSGAVVISHSHNQGVGAALQTGIKYALSSGADVIVNIDGDGQFNATDIPKLIAPIAAGKADFVSTTRFADPDLYPDMPAIKIWGNKWMTRIINFITGQKFTDVSCGFRAYSREAALRLSLFGKFTYTQETFVDFAFKGIRMVQVPLKVRGQRKHGKSRVASNLWSYGFKAASIIFYAALDYRPFYFIGLPGLIVIAAGVICGLFLLAHYLATGQTYPYRSLVSVAGQLLIIGFIIFFMSLLAEMMCRNRRQIEEMLYLQRVATYNKDGKR